MNPPDNFEDLVTEHYGALFRFAMSLTRSEADAKDLTQETFHTWATKGNQLRDASKAKTWLFTTLHRRFLKMRRRETRFFHESIDEVSEEVPYVAPDTGSKIGAAQLLHALAKVDDVYQAAVALYYLDDISYNEIATILGVPIGTVKSRISRGIMQLRELLLSKTSGMLTSQKGATVFDHAVEQAAPCFISSRSIMGVMCGAGALKVPA
jgi:RNA polymerase sigma-70 factor, ECF subfamily